ncbi:MAG: AraC family transcriptional regulator ligand-binding domain-containing protein [Jannaschia sp.]
MQIVSKDLSRSPARMRIGHLLSGRVSRLKAIQHPEFSTAVLLGVICKLLDLDPAKVVADVGLLQRIVTGHGVLVAKDDFFLLWDTIVRLGHRPDFAAFVRRALANGATSPVFFALSCAPNLKTGFERFARFKHVCGPLGMSVRLHDKTLRIRLVPLRADGRIRPSIAGPILTFCTKRRCPARAGRLSPMRCVCRHLPILVAILQMRSASRRPKASRSWFIRRWMQNVGLFPRTRNYGPRWKRI